MRNRVRFQTGVQQSHTSRDSVRNPRGGAAGCFISTFLGGVHTYGSSISWLMLSLVNSKALLPWESRKNCKKIFFSKKGSFCRTWFIGWPERNFSHLLNLASDCCVKHSADKWGLHRTVLWYIYRWRTIKLGCTRLCLICKATAWKKYQWDQYLPAWTNNKPR